MAKRCLHEEGVAMSKTHLLHLLCDIFASLAELSQSSNVALELLFVAEATDSIWFVLLPLL